ncbi:Na+/H+ antiporter NhaC [Desertibacillus haloalkaliphilus]|uniref:Na+/H+ antiporter NhaC n=1 Tax=Desertibacillus haloalkaliphilus TaxID=1328930 RepID=UPI001C278700|nr:Na+/H+ antiporter NhaC [Desertibacillus haloalkaliphilus]MBU8905726.1 Na+/H+ antiporter NhaC [Desertibacillus haloalkaliphilus]
MAKTPSLFVSFFTLVGMLAVIFYSIFVLGVEPHIPLAVCLVAMVVIGLLYGCSWAKIEEGFIDGIKLGIKPIIILCLVGMVIAVWMMSGTVPTLLTIGLSVISPQWFALSAMFICIIVSSFSGSSFTTIGTVGVALIGVGMALGVPLGIAAGAIICGACFGDKMSPLSDTTNFAPGILNVELFSHIRHMMWTTFPSLIITATIFFFIGKNSTDSVPLANIDEAIQTLAVNFNISWLTLLSPLLVVVMAFKRWPVIPVLVVGIATGLLTALLVQGNITTAAWMAVLQHGFTLESGNEIVDGIVNRGGLQSMMWSVSLIIIALAFGGILQSIGLLQAFIDGLTRYLHHQGHLIASTAGASIGVNVLTGEQYLSILLPGQTFKPFYEKANLQLKNLSRTIEDAGTLVNPLIPWGVSGAFFASTLGVPVAEYLPYAFFLLLSPVFTVLLGYLNIGVAKKA